MNSLDQILAEALKLPEPDRAQIAERLLRSLDVDRQEKDPGYDEAWAAEIEARLIEVDEGQAISTDSDVVLERIRRKVERAEASRSTEELAR